MAALLIYHAEFKLHDPSPAMHPENPYRLDRALYAIHEYGINTMVSFLEPPRLDPLQVFSLVHDRRYVEYILSLTSKDEVVWVDPDTYVAPGTRRALERLAGSALIAAKHAVDERATSMILARPPSHHAGIRGPAMNAPTLGFCLLNATATAAAALVGYGRVAILDFDLHHGNGTQEIFYSNANILHVDIHQDYRTIYPGSGSPEQTGSGSAAGTKVNINIPPGARDDIMLDALERALGVVKEWAPDYVVVSAGFDAYRNDNDMALVSANSTFYYKMGLALASLRVPVLAFLEGGYGEGLERGLAAFLHGLLGLEDPVGDSLHQSPDTVWAEYEDMLTRLQRALRERFRVKA